MAIMVHDLQQCIVCNSGDFVRLDIRGRQGVEASYSCEECCLCGHGGDQFIFCVSGVPIVHISERYIFWISIPKSKYKGVTTESYTAHGILEYFSHHMGGIAIDCVHS